jgi:hypothetical protein
MTGTAVTRLAIGRSPVRQRNSRGAAPKIEHLADLRAAHRKKANSKAD